ncbi:MAG: AmmeMemoRadiSam system radical SAM enzyme [Desulfovibrio sp.]|nr:AmmeMemoRadiSam system radical SAM enzyme [Desulfovibrio sp.]
MLPTLLWSNTNANTVQCHACAHACVLKSGMRGICGARLNQNGRLVSVLTDIVSTVQMDPVEKKPLYHFLPGSQTFSIGSVGCNFHCNYCQNCHISVIPKSGVISGRRVNAEALINLAVAKHAKSISFTYNEPTLSVELIQEVAERALAYQMPIVLVSNGFMSEDFIVLLRNYVHAVNIDLKAFSDKFYREYCGGRLKPVLDTLKRIKFDTSWWLEVTTLVIPDLNDSPEQIRECANFIKNELGDEVPWHLTAFHGAHKMQQHPSTSIDQLQLAWRIGKETGLRYVYMGNVSKVVGGNTYCPVCSELVVERSPWKIAVSPKGICRKCGAQIPGVWR